MSEQRTVLVLGAGSAKPYGFPTGNELARAISDSFPAASVRLATRPPLRPRFRQKTTRLADGLEVAASIDDLLADNRHDRDLCMLGKCAIAADLLPREREDSLFPGPDEEHWYRYLWHYVKAGGPDRVVLRSPRIVTFNYDRSLEQYLFLAAQKQFPKSEGEAADIVNELRVAHVHGQVGRLPWQPGDDLAVPFGGGDLKYRPKITSAAKGMKIVHEDQSEGSDYGFRWARWYLREAHVIVFLGFGYHESNLRKLFAGLDRRGKLVVAGTASGIADQAGERAIEQVRSLLPRCELSFDLRDLKCCEFLETTSYL